MFGLWGEMIGKKLLESVLLSVTGNKICLAHGPLYTYLPQWEAFRVNVQNTLLHDQGHSRSNVPTFCPLYISLVSSPILQIIITHMSISLRQWDRHVCNKVFAEQRLETPCYKAKVIVRGQKSHVQNSCSPHVSWTPRSILKLFHANVHPNVATCRERFQTSCFKVSKIIPWGQKSNTQHSCPLHITWILRIFYTINSHLNEHVCSLKLASLQGHTGRANSHI